MALEKIMSTGGFVSSEMLVTLLGNEFRINGSTGRYLLDGFPRNNENLDFWHKIIGNQADVEFLLFFDCPSDILEKRLIKRGETSG